MLLTFKQQNSAKFVILFNILRDELIAFVISFLLKDEHMLVEQQHVNYLNFAIVRSSLRNKNVKLIISTNKMYKFYLTKLSF